LERAKIKDTNKQTSNMTTSNVSTAVKIVVSMVVVAALVATRFSSIKVRRERDIDVLVIFCVAKALRRLPRGTKERPFGYGHPFSTSAATI
jgi:hypothetical protein